MSQICKSSTLDYYLSGLSKRNVDERGLFINIVKDYKSQAQELSESKSKIQALERKLEMLSRKATS